jgi:hypothetical protein
VCNSEWLPRLELLESTNKNYCEQQQRKRHFSVNFTLIIIRCLRDIFVTQKWNFFWSRDRTQWPHSVATRFSWPHCFGYVWGWMKSEVCERKVITRDQLLASILHAAARIKRHEYQLRRTTRHLHTGVAKWTEVGGGIFEQLLWAVTDLSFPSNQFVIWTLT